MHAAHRAVRFFAVVTFGVLLVPAISLALSKQADNMCSPYYAQCGCDQVPDKNGKCVHQDPQGELPHSNVHGCAPGVCKDTTQGHITSGICSSENHCEGEICDGKPCPGKPSIPVQTTPGQTEPAPGTIPTTPQSTQGQSLFNQFFNPTPLSEQQTPLSPSAQNIEDAIKGFTSPTPSAQSGSPQSLEGGTTPGISNNIVQPINEFSAPGTQPLYQTSEFSPQAPQTLGQTNTFTPYEPGTAPVTSAQSWWEQAATNIQKISEDVGNTIQGYLANPEVTGRTGPTVQEMQDADSSKASILGGECASGAGPACGAAVADHNKQYPFNPITKQEALDAGKQQLDQYKAAGDVKSYNNLVALQAKTFGTATGEDLQTALSKGLDTVGLQPGVAQTAQQIADQAKAVQSQIDNLKSSPGFDQNNPDYAKQLQALEDRKASLQNDFENTASKYGIVCGTGSCAVSTSNYKAAAGDLAQYGITQQAINTVQNQTVQNLATWAASQNTMGSVLGEYTSGTNYDLAKGTAQTVDELNSQYKSIIESATAPDGSVHLNAEQTVQVAQLAAQIQANVEANKLAVDAINESVPLSSLQPSASDLKQAVADSFQTQADRFTQNANTVAASRDEIISQATMAPGISPADCIGDCQVVQVQRFGGTTETIPLSEYKAQTDAVIADMQAKAATYQKLADFMKSDNPLAQQIAPALAEGGPKAGLIASNLNQMLDAQATGAKLSGSPATVDYNTGGLNPEYLSALGAGQIAVEKVDAIQRLTTDGPLTDAERIAIYPSTMPLSAIDAQIARANLADSNISKIFSSPLAIYDAVSLYNNPTPAQWAQMATMSPTELSDFKTAAVSQAVFATALDVTTIAGLTPPGARIAGALFDAVVPSVVSTAVNDTVAGLFKAGEYMLPAEAGVIKYWATGEFSGATLAAAPAYDALSVSNPAVNDLVSTIKSEGTGDLVAANRNLTGGFDASVVGSAPEGAAVSTEAVSAQTAAEARLATAQQYFDDLSAARTAQADALSTAGKTEAEINQQLSNLDKQIKIASNNVDAFQSIVNNPKGVTASIPEAPPPPPPALTEQIQAAFDSETARAASLQAARDAAAADMQAAGATEREIQAAMANRDAEIQRATQNAKVYENTIADLKNPSSVQVAAPSAKPSLQKTVIGNTSEIPVAANSNQLGAEVPAVRPQTPGGRAITEVQGPGAVEAAPKEATYGNPCNVGKAALYLAALPCASWAPEDVAAQSASAQERTPLVVPSRALNAVAEVLPTGKWASAIAGLGITGGASGALASIAGVPAETTVPNTTVPNPAEQAVQPVSPPQTIIDYIRQNFGDVAAQRAQESLSTYGDPWIGAFSGGGGAGGAEAAPSSPGSPTPSQPAPTPSSAKQIPLTPNQTPQTLQQKVTTALSEAGLVPSAQVIQHPATLPQNGYSPQADATTERLPDGRFLVQTSDGRGNYISSITGLSQLLGELAAAKNAAAAKQSAGTPKSQEKTQVPQLSATEQTVLTDVIQAFHGSPADFMEFDLSKIDSGEGNQAFGHGFYFGSQRETATYYRDTLAPDGSGHLYEVQISGSPDAFLDWDALASEQSPYIKGILSKKFGVNTKNPFSAVNGESIYRHLSQIEFDSYEALSAGMKSAGITGIRFKDAKSRAANVVGVTYNYVVFSPEDIKIVAKDGIPLHQQDTLASEEATQSPDVSVPMVPAYISKVAQFARAAAIATSLGAGLAITPPFLADTVSGFSDIAEAMPGTRSVQSCLSDSRCLNPQINVRTSRYAIGSQLPGGGYMPGPLDNMIASQTYPFGTFGQLCNSAGKCVYAFVGDTGAFDNPTYRYTKIDVPNELANKIGPSVVQGRTAMSFTPLGVAPVPQAVAIARAMNAGQPLDQAVASNKAKVYAYAPDIHPSPIPTNVAESKPAAKPVEVAQNTPVQPQTTPAVNELLNNPTPAAKTSQPVSAPAALPATPAPQAGATSPVPPSLEGNAAVPQQIAPTVPSVEEGATTPNEKFYTFAEPLRSMKLTFTPPIGIRAYIPQEIWNKLDVVDVNTPSITFTKAELDSIRWADMSALAYINLEHIFNPNLDPKGYLPPVPMPTRDQGIRDTVAFYDFVHAPLMTNPPPVVSDVYTNGTAPAPQTSTPQIALADTISKLLNGFSVAPSNQPSPVITVNIGSTPKAAETKQQSPFPTLSQQGIEQAAAPKPTEVAQTATQPPATPAVKELLNNTTPAQQVSQPVSAPAALPANPTPAPSPAEIKQLTDHVSALKQEVAGAQKQLNAIHSAGDTAGLASKMEAGLTELTKNGDQNLTVMNAGRAATGQAAKIASLAGDKALAAKLEGLYGRLNALAGLAGRVTKEVNQNYGGSFMKAYFASDPGVLKLKADRDAALAAGHGALTSLKSVNLSAGLQSARSKVEAQVAQFNTQLSEAEKSLAGAQKAATTQAVVVAQPAPATTPQAVETHPAPPLPDLTQKGIEQAAAPKPTEVAQTATQPPATPAVKELLNNTTPAQQVSQPVSAPAALPANPTPAPTLNTPPDIVQQSRVQKFFVRIASGDHVWDTFARGFSYAGQWASEKVFGVAPPKNIGSLTTLPYEAKTPEGSSAAYVCAGGATCTKVYASGLFVSATPDRAFVRLDIQSKPVNIPAAVDSMKQKGVAPVVNAAGPFVGGGTKEFFKVIDVAYNKGEAVGTNISTKGRDGLIITNDNGQVLVANKHSLKLGDFSNLGVDVPAADADVVLDVTSSDQALQKFDSIMRQNKLSAMANLLLIDNGKFLGALNDSYTSRRFFIVMPDGSTGILNSVENARTNDFARVAQAMGAKYAVNLDTGYYNESTLYLADGSTKNLGSRTGNDAIGVISIGVRNESLAKRTEALPANTQPQTTPAVKQLLNNPAPAVKTSQPVSAPAALPATKVQPVAPSPAPVSGAEAPIVGRKPEDVGNESPTGQTNVENSVPPPDLALVQNADGAYELQLQNDGFTTQVPVVQDNGVAPAPQAPQEVPNSTAEITSTNGISANAANDNVPQWYRDFTAFMQNAEESVLTALGQAPKPATPQVAINPVPVIPTIEPAARDVVAESAAVRTNANPTTLGDRYQLLDAPSVLPLRVVDSVPADAVPVVLHNVDLPNNMQVTIGAKDLASIGGADNLASFMQNGSVRGLVSAADKETLDLMVQSGITPADNIAFYPLSMQPKTQGLLARIGDWFMGKFTTLPQAPSASAPESSTQTQAQPGAPTAAANPAPGTVPTAYPLPPDQTGGGGGGSGGGSGGGGNGGEGGGPSEPPQGPGWGAYAWQKATGFCLYGPKTFLTCSLLGSTVTLMGVHQLTGWPNTNPTIPPVLGPATTKPPSTTPSSTATKPPAVVPPAPAPQTPPKTDEKVPPAPELKITTPPLGKAVPAGAPIGGAQPGSPQSTLGGSSRNGGFFGLGSLLGQLLSKLFGTGAPQQPQTPTAPRTPTPTPISTTTPSTTPIISPVVNPPTVAPGGKAVISWSTLGLSSCTLLDPSGATVGQGSNGSIQTPALSATTAFTLECTSTSGATSSVQVPVSVQ